MSNTHSTSLVGASSQYWYVNDTASLSITGDLTISAWIKLTTAPTGTYYFIVAKDDFGSPSNLVSYFLDVNGAGATMRFGISDTGAPSRETTASSTTGVTAGVWTHLAVVYTASTGTCKFYKNGAHLSGEDGSGLRTSIADTTQEFQIGTVDNNGTPFSYLNGLVDDVRVWSRALSDSEVGTMYSSPCTANNGADLKGWWKFDNNGNDSSGNGNNLTGANSPTFSTDVPYACANSNFLPNLLTLGVG